MDVAGDSLGRDGTTILRWPAAAYLATEKHFGRSMGYEPLWMLEAALREEQQVSTDIMVAKGGNERDEVMESVKSESKPLTVALS